MPMRVLFFSQHFAPEITASRMRAQAFAEGLTALGHQVEVICAVPNHPAGVVHEGYRRHWLDRRSIDGYDVTYVPVWTSPRKTTRNRILLYATYAASATTVGAVARRPDVVLATSPPLPVAAAAAMAAAGHRIPWVMDVRDLWPEAAVVLGELRGRRAVRLAEWLERRLYGSARAIVTVTDPFRRQIIQTGASAQVEVIPNGTTQRWLDAGEVPADRAAAGMPADRFVWMYAGNLGIAQGLETAVRAAGVLGPEFRLILLGDGPQRERLRELAAGLPEGAVEFRNAVQPEIAATQMRAADALLVSLGAAPELAKFVPSKLFDCCALGRPVIVAAAGEAPRLAAESAAAATAPAGDAAALAGAVRDLRDDPGRGATLATAGRRFAAGYLRERQVERLERLLVDVARRGR